MAASSIPTKQEIDALAGLYLEAKAKAEEAQNTASAFRDQLLEMVNAHGFLPPRATKSRRLLGAIYKITATEGSSLETDGTSVLRFKACLDGAKLSRIFRKLFRAERVYVPRPNAQELIRAIAEKNLGSNPMPAHAGFPRNALALFNECLIVKSKSPGLDVEPISDGKKKG